MSLADELLPGIFRVPLGPFQAYLLLGGDGWTLIDTGLVGSAALLRDAMHTLSEGAPLARVIVTHGHEDHAGSLAELAALPGVETIAHRLDAPVIRGEAAMPPPNLTPEERPLYDSIQPNVVPAPSAPVTVEVEEGDAIAVGAFTGVVLHVPGHTPGSIAIHLPGERALFTGDTIASVGATPKPILGPFNCDREQAARSYERLARLDVRLACFGHGLPLAGEDASARLLASAAAR